MNDSTAIKIKLLGLGGILGATVFFVSILTLQILVPEINLFHGYVSNYANSRYGALFTTGIIIHGFANLGIAAGISLALRRSVRSAWTRAGLAFFVISSIGVILGGLFPTDVPGAKTIVGTLHVLIATSGFIIEPIVLALLAYGFSKEPLWRSYALPTAMFVVAGAIALAWLAVSLYTHAAPGLAERLTLAIFLFWEFLTAWRLAVFPFNHTQSV